MSRPVAAGTRRGHMEAPELRAQRRAARALTLAIPLVVPRPRWLGDLALLLPPLGAAGTELLPALGGADPALVATAGAMAAVNATREVLLWQGLFVAIFPDDGREPPVGVIALAARALPTVSAGSAGPRG
jgi:hypothetical protein